MRSWILPLVLLSAARSQDPPAPAGGFPISAVLDRDLIWSDGYRTRVDVYYPRVAPPSSGWPAVYVAHGGGGSRKSVNVLQYCVRLARAGYCAFGFDIRGDGETPVLNPGGGLVCTTTSRSLQVRHKSNWCRSHRPPRAGT